MSMVIGFAAELLVSTTLLPLCGAGWRRFRHWRECCQQRHRDRIERVWFRHLEREV